VRRTALRTVLLCTVACGLPSVPLRAQFGQNKITYESFDWHVYQAPHFDVYYYPAEEPFLEQVVSFAESAYLKISRDLDHELRFRVPLVIFKTHGEFQQTNITLSELPEAVAAFAEPVQNRMVLPIDLPPDKLYELIAHELVHIFEYSLLFEGSLGRALRSNAPVWLMEGLASYLAQDEDHLDRMAIRDAVVNQTLPPIQALDVVTFLTYRFGHAVFDYIEQEHGKEGLRSFLFEYRKVLLNNNLEKAFKEAFGYDLDGFNRRFARYLRAKYFPVLLENKSPEDHGTEIGVKKPGVVTFSPTISPSGELVAVLATPKLEFDLLVLSPEDGSTVKNLTKGWTNSYRYLVAEAFQGRRDLSWSPVSDDVAVFARRENHWPLLIFDAVKGGKQRDIVLDDIVECSSPAFSPDGRRIAFEGNRNGVVDLFEVDLDTQAVRNLTQDDAFDANPWYAADGKTLLYNRRVGHYWKIFSVDLSDAEKKTQITLGPSSDIQPAYSRDGTRIYFSSDRGEHGVFNIYALDLATGDLAQYTDVVGGCFAPVEMAERDGERQLAFTSYFEGAFRLYRMSLAEPEQKIAAGELLAEPLEAEPFEPPLNLTVDETKKAPYKLKWDIEAPYLEVGLTDDGTFLSNIALQFADLQGDHRIQVLAGTVSDFAAYNVSYFNLKRRFAWGASGYDIRDYYLRETTAGVDREEASRLTGVTSFVQYPLSRHYRVDASAGLQENSQDLPVFDPQVGDYVFESITDRFATLSVGLTGDTTRFQRFGPLQGKRFRVSTLFAPHLSGDSDGDMLEHRLDFRAYRQLTRRSLLAVRFASIYNTGDRENVYGFGGLNQLRGFDFRDFIGSRIAWANAEFRFPLIDELRFPVLSLFQIRGFFFLDAGAAWFQDDLWYDPNLFGGFGDFRVDAAGQTVPFRFWNSDENELQDGRASYGTGFQLFFLGGLQFNWVWAKRLDYLQYEPVLQDFVKADGGGTRMDFYIAFDF
jgi:hypothetical protein